MICKNSWKTRVALWAHLLLFVLALLAQPVAAQVLTITVGDGPDCSAGSLEEAVDFAHQVTAQERLILLERGVYEGVELLSTIEQLTLRGGFDSCSDEEPAGNAKSVLVGTGEAPVITLDQDVLPPPAGLPSLVLENIELTGGRGGLFVQSPARVRLEDVSVIGNQAAFGAGIRIQAFPHLVEVVLVRTSVNGNRTLPEVGTPHGGGIYCHGGGLLRIGPGSALFGNATAPGGFGGGLYLDGCEARVDGDVALKLNVAHRGGAVAAVQNAAIRFFGDASGSADLAFNRAEEHDGVGGLGGGAYVESGAFFEARSGILSDNRALPESSGGLGDGQIGGQGGGVYLDGATALLDGVSPECVAPCLQLADNRAADGAGAFVANGSTLDIVNAHVDGNVAEQSIFRVDSGAPGVNSALSVVSSFLTRNVGSQLVDVAGGSALELTHASVGGNPNVGTVIQAREISSVAVKSSVLFEPSAFLLNPGDSVVIESSCSLVSDDTFFPQGTVQEADPLFRDANVGDLHLDETSPAVDACPVTPDLTVDFDGQLRVVDQDLVPDDGTPADAGADELERIVPPEPPLFADGFESQDLSAWSVAVGAS